MSESKLQSSAALQRLFEEGEKRHQRLTAPFLRLDSITLIDELQDIIALACGHNPYGDDEPPPPKCWLITEEEYEQINGRLRVLWDRALEARNRGKPRKNFLPLGGEEEQERGGPPDDVA